MSGWIPRPATVADTAEVVRLAAVLFTSMGWDATDPEWRRAAEKSFSSRLGTEVVGAVVDHPELPGRLVASSAASVCTRLPSPRNLAARAAYVQWVATDEDWRGRGLGRAVMTGLLAQLHDADVPVVELHATSDGEPLYRDLGFTEGDHLAMRRTGPAPPPTAG